MSLDGVGGDAHNELSYLLKKSGVLIIFYKPKTVPVNWVFVKLKPKPAFSKNLTRNPFTNFDYVVYQFPEKIIITEMLQFKTNQS